jgi:hypothetical protein
MLVDPIIRDTEHDLEKFSHHFEEKQRVRVKTDGRVGRIENFNAKQHVNVRLDSGHLIECHPDEIEPADWEATATEKLQRALNAAAVVDPILRAGDVLQKSARTQFRIGQSVIEKGQRRTGTVTGITPAGLVEIKLGPGVSCLCIPADVEAA